MGKTLMILEVSRKQDYIFSGKKLAENAARSGEIAYVTDDKFFRTVAGNLYRAENLVYTGGGHTVLCFEENEKAVAFAMAVSEAVLRQFPGMELFIGRVPYDNSISPGENVKELTKALEKKKARRAGTFSGFFGF